MNSEKSNNHINAIIISTTIIASIVLLLIMLIGSSQSLAYAAAEPVKLSNSIFYAPVGNQSFNPTATTSPFGARSVNGGSSWHPAVDYGASVGATDGAAIYPIYEGQIEKKGYVVGETGSFKAGYYVTVRHQIDGKIFYSHYQHMKYACSLGTGTQVHPGDVIGYVGHSGDENNGNNTMGSHLDLRIFEGGVSPWTISKPYQVAEEGDGYAISTSGIKYYHPAKVLNGDCIIPGTEGAAGLPVTISYEKSTYKVIKGCNLKTAPNASADNAGSVSVGDTITINALVKNSNNNGNMWLQTTDGKYLFSGLKLNESTGKYEVDNSQNQHVSHLEDKADISISGQDFPSGVLTLPITNYALKGNISNSSNTITSISGGIYYAGTNTVAFNLSAEQPVNGRNFVLAGSAIDNALTFRSITEAGNYEFRLTVYYYTNRMQKTISKVFKSSFTVSSSGTSTPSGDVYKVLSTNTLGMNVRSTPCIKSDNVIGRLDPNQTITVTKTATADGYTWGYGYMSSNGLTGWVVISRTDWIQKISSSSIAVTGVIMYPEDADKCEIYIGQTTTASATIFPNNATNKALTWTSSNPNVLAITRTYDQYAELVGKSKGQAVITCTTADGGFKASGTITVLKEATGITLTPTSLTLDVGDTYTMKPTVLPTDASNQTVHWFTSDNTIVRIQDESKNLIKALKPGTVTITAMSESRGHTAECTVTVGYELDVNGRLDGGKVLGTCNDLGTFDVYINGSLSSESKSDHVSHGLSNGTTYEIKNVKAKSGYRYKGLASDVSYGGDTGGIITNSDVYIVLDFVTTYPVTYNANGGTGEPRAQAKDKGDKTFEISSVRPTRDKYTFLGWATSPDATEAQYQPGDSYTQDASLTLYAVWERKPIYGLYVNARLDGGEVLDSCKDFGMFDVYINDSLSSEASIVYYNTGLPKGTTYEIRNIKAKSGYRYNGQNISGTIASADVNIILDFVTIYQISYNANGGTGAPSMQEKVKGTPLTLRSDVPTREGYTFLGWATSSTATTAQYQPGDSYTQDASLTLYAVWKLDVIYVSQIKLSDAALTLEIGDTHTLSAAILPSDAANPTVTWSTDNSDVATVNNGTVTAVGRGTANVTCTANDGSGVYAVCAITVNEPHTHSPIMIRPTLATRAENGLSIGFRCACGEVTQTQKIIESDGILSLPAALKRIDAEAFAGANMQQIIIPDGMTEIGARAFANCRKLLVVSMPNSVGSIADDAFDGCDTQYLCIVANDDSYAAQYADNHGLNHCSPIVKCNVIFDANGGECDTEMLSVEVGNALGSLPIPTKEGCIFSGWYKASGEPVDADTVIQESADLLLRAKWSCAITFNANGGFCANGSKTIYCGDAIGTLPTPTRTYYTFNGWYTASSGGTKVSESTTFATAVTLYAQWTRNTCTITFNANGGSCSTASKKINCGDAIGTLPTPTRTYYTFNGWYTATSGGTKINTSTTFASSTTVYAQWSSKGYGSWSDWSTSAVSSSSTRQVETKVERVQTGTKTTYSYDRYLYYHPGNGYNMSSYASNWATSQGYSGSWQYLTLDYALTAAGSTDGVAKYSGYYRDGNQYWWHQTVNTEAVYTDVTYYRYRDLIQ